ncbi:hypothetical protein AVEN_106442-1 [Araneus ventricosus]|uniref:Uncharacterized protein n=1 Tax=Araneus ventricosus TaxID=182803 RepID=A0A4Y2ASZ0_ARAVE|nr:hypothetical protein AVEN_106442-1 [Araneus ventricosus]
MFDPGGLKVHRTRLSPASCSDAGIRSAVPFPQRMHNLQQPVGTVLRSLPVDSLPSISKNLRGRGGLLVGSGRRISVKICRVFGLLHAKSYADGQTSSCCCGTEVWRGGASNYYYKGVVVVI